MSLEVNMSKQNKPKRPVYDLEFKQDTAKLVIEKGYTHQQAADRLGVSLSAIGRWVRAERGTTIETKSTPSLSGQAELVRLRKEVEQLRMKREILKKAAVFFAKKSSKVYFYSRSTEELPCYGVMSGYEGQYQCFLCMESAS